MSFTISQHLRKCKFWESWVQLVVLELLIGNQFQGAGPSESLVWPSEPLKSAGPSESVVWPSEP